MTMHGMIDAENEAPGSSEGLAPLTAEEEAQIAQRLMPLLDLQMRRLTQGDSTSLRVEVAEELMASIRFTLGGPSAGATPLDRPPCRIRPSGYGCVR